MAETRKAPKSIRFPDEMETKLLKEASKTKTSFHSVVIKIINEYFINKPKSKN